MWQTLSGLAPLTLVAAGLATWTVVDIARSFRPSRRRVREGRHD